MRDRFNADPAVQTLALGLAALILAPAAASAAQATDDGLTEVVVTARKRLESAQDIPESITTVSADVIERAGISSINDIHMIATSVNLNRRQDESPNVVLRGVGSFGNVQGVGFYVDDVQIFTGMTERTEDIGRIEVLKGPQGTLYGGNNIGGAIKYVLKEPSYNWSGEGRAQVGSLGKKTLAGAVTGPLVEDKLAFRFSAYGESGDGFMYNAFQGDEIDQKEEYGARLSLRADLTDHLNATLSLRASRLDQDGFNLYYRATAPDAYRRSVNYDEGLNFKRDIAVPTLAINWTNDSGYTVTSISAFQSATANYTADIDFEADPDNRIGLDSYYFDQAFSQEVRLASPTDGRAFNWLLGLYGLDRQSASATDIYLYNPDGTVFLTIPLASEDEWKQFAGFVSGNYELSDRWSLSAGGRINYAKRATFDREVELGGSVDGTSFLPKASIQYQAKPGTMLYFTYSNGLEPGAIATLGSGELLPYSPEKTKNFEIGVKSELLDRRLRLNAAVFFTDYANRLFESYVANVGGAPEEYIQNIGDSSNLGAEAEIEWRASRDLTLSAGVSVIDVSWKNGVMFFDKGVQAEIDLGETNKKPPFVPSSSATAAADWTHPLSDALSLRSRVDVAYTGKSFWDIPNAYEQEAYTIANASIGVDVGAWSVAVQGRNLFDTEYNNEYLAMVYSGLPADLASRGEPRTWLLSLSARF